MDTSRFRELQQDPGLEPRVPIATYRLQFNRAFTFEQARRLVPYLAALGVSDL
jgi:(1->4)-alpha-D-glucan 1-alpha-D-glucosylmutase